MKECLDEGTLQGYLDGELSSAAAERVASHLAACLACAELASEAQGEMSLVSTALQPEFDALVPTAQLRNRVDEAISKLQADSVSRVNAGQVRRGSWFGFRDLFTGFPHRAFSYAAVAAVIVAAVSLGVIYLKTSRVTPVVEVAKNLPSQTASPQSSPVPAASPNQAPAPVKTPIMVQTGHAPRKTLPRRSTRVNETAAKLLPGEQNFIKTIAVLDAKIKSGARPMRAGLQVEYEHNLAVVDQAISSTRVAVQKNPRDPDAAQFMLSAYQSKVDLMTQVADARLFNTQK